MKTKDPKSKRYMMEFKGKILEVTDLMTPERLSQYKPEEMKDMRYFLFNIKGQSFIYHQIRKMIGILAQSCQMDLPDAYIDNSFSNNVVRVWLAPAEGLFLHRVDNKHSIIKKIFKFLP